MVKSCSHTEWRDRPDSSKMKVKKWKRARNIWKFGWEGEEEIGQKTTVGIILVITFVTITFHKDVSTKPDRKEQRVKSIYKERCWRRQD